MAVPNQGTIKFVTFPGYEWAPDARCWQAPFGNDSNGDDDTPGHINYFFNDTAGSIGSTTCPETPASSGS